MLHSQPPVFAETGRLAHKLTGPGTVFSVPGKCLAQTGGGLVAKSCLALL